MKKIVITTIALVVALSSFAQDVKDDPRYGETPEERVETVRKISIYSEYVKTNNFKDAYEQGWLEVFNKAPLASVNTYTHGVKIMRALYDDARKAKNAELQAKYSEELMKVYEQRLKYLDQLNAQSTNKTTEGSIMGQYAHDYRARNPKPSIAKAYELLRKAVDLTKGETQYYVLDDLMSVSSQRFANNKDNQEYRDALLQDYIDCAGYIDEFIAKQTNEQVISAATTVKENIDSHFVGSGAADCESLQNIYGPKIEENKDNLEYLTKVVKLMSIFECQSSDAYFKAAEYAHAISPSAQTAKSLGALYYKQREDIDKAIEYYNQAIELADDKNVKADIYYAIASLYMLQEKYDSSRSNVNKCIANNANKGDAYILLAQLYASNINWSNEPALNRCAYFAVLDKLEQAKKVDSSVAERANNLIRDYKKQIPASEDLFMFGYKAGDKIEIKGWINETTTIR